MSRAKRESRYISLSKAARQLHMSAARLAKLATQKIVEGHVHRGRWRFLQSEVRAARMRTLEPHLFPAAWGDPDATVKLVVDENDKPTGIILVRNANALVERRTTLREEELE